MHEREDATQQAVIRNGEGHDPQETGERWGELPETVEEFQKLLQSEADKRVTQALKTAQEKWQQEWMKKLEAEKVEAGRLAVLAAEQREREVLHRYGKEIEKMERALKQKELEIKTMDLLIRRRLPAEFKEFILGEDEASTLQRMESFSSLWRMKLDEAVKTVVAGNQT